MSVVRRLLQTYRLQVARDLKSASSQVASDLNRPNRSSGTARRRRRHWQEAWHSYPGSLDGSPAVWSVDLGAVDAAPWPNLPVRLDVEVQYPARPDGLAADETRVSEVESTVRALVAGLGGGYLGRVTSAGLCRFTAHLPDEPSAPIQIVGATATTTYDPHWAYVRDTLAPDVRQHRLLADREVLGELAQRGDRLATPRTVEHVALFAELDPAEEAAADLRADGFAASVERDDEGEFALTALRDDPVEPPTVHELTWAVQETVERHGGTYEGWYCAQAA